MRIDAVHYCKLEEIFTEKRRRKSRRDEDVPAVRMRLLTNTLRDNDWLASLVQFLKLPYMTREMCKADLARAVAVCPNLRHVDLPDGFYSGDPSCNLLRQELQTHCPDLRKMKYHAGSEQFFQHLAQRQWQALEVLELHQLRIDPSTFRIVLASLPVLHELSVSSVSCFTDEIFADSPSIPPFPPLQTLAITECHSLTALGLTRYLEKAQNREVLTALSLKDTGVTVPDLPSLLWSATNLLSLAITQTVSQPLPLEPLPPLQSSTLHTLHYEILPSDDMNLNIALQNPTTSHYTYLTTSLQSGYLSSLTSLYIRDPTLPETLLLTPPQPPFSPVSPTSPKPPTPGIARPLNIYIKATDESDWLLTTLTPSSDASQGPSSPISSPGRPVSFIAAERGLGPQWRRSVSGVVDGGEARGSVVVGNGFGGYLAVPAEGSGRPRSSGSWKDSSSSPGERVEAPGSPGLGGSWWKRRSAGPGTERRGSRADLWR